MRTKEIIKGSIEPKLESTLYGTRLDLFIEGERVAFAFKHNSSEVFDAVSISASLTYHTTSHSTLQSIEEVIDYVSEMMADDYTKASNFVDRIESIAVKYLIAKQNENKKVE